MAQELEVEAALERNQGLLNLSALSAPQASVSAHLQNLDPVISSIRDALDVAISVSIPALVKLAVKEATMPKAKPRGKRARSPSPATPLFWLLRTSFSSSPCKRSRKTKHLEPRSRRKHTKAAKRRAAKRCPDSSSISSSTSSSSSEPEEGELSGKEAEETGCKSS